MSISAPQPLVQGPLKHRVEGEVPARRIARVGRWLALIFVFGGVFELTCRVEDWVMYRMPMGSPYRSVEDLLIRDADGMHGRPNAQFEKWVMNEIGTRGPSAAVVPDSGTIRVIAVGASETFGLRESVNHEYPRQLEDSLSVRRPALVCGGKPARFEVLNAAFAGMTLPTIDQDIRNRLRRFRPAVIVAYPSPVAYLEDDSPIAARPDSAPGEQTSGRFRALYPRSRERLRDQLKQMLPEVIKGWLRQKGTDAATRSHPSGWKFTAVPEERLKAFESDLRRVVGTVRSIGAVPVLVTHANLFVGRQTVDKKMLVAWEKFYPRSTAETLIRFDSLARVVTLRVGLDSNVTVADAATKLAAASPAAFADFVHFTDLGAATIAGVVADGVYASIRVLPDVCQGHGEGDDRKPRQ